MSIIGRRWPRIQVVDADEIDKAFLIGEREPNVGVSWGFGSLIRQRITQHSQGEIHILLPMSIDDFASPSE